MEFLEIWFVCYTSKNNLSDFFDQIFDQIFGQVFDKIFDQGFDQIFGQGFDQVLGVGKTTNTVSRTTRP